MRCRVLCIKVFGLVVSFLVLSLVNFKVVLFVLLLNFVFWLVIIRIEVVISESKILNLFENFIIDVYCICKVFLKRLWMERRKY